MLTADCGSPVAHMFSGECCLVMLDYATNCDLCDSLLATGGPQTVTQVGSVDKDTKVGSVDTGF